MNRKTIALGIGVALCLLVMTPLVFAINHFDRGVSLMLVAPLVIWLMLRLGRVLERWARGEPETLPPDPDYPDEGS